MFRIRVIPILLLRNKGLVKTIKFSKSKYIGDPINAVKIFNAKEVDELVFLDIDASKEGRNPNFNLISDIAKECFMPFGYGGGIKNLDEIKTLFSIGVEKVILNSSALRNLSLVQEASSIYGSQSIVISIDVFRNVWGKYKVYSHAGIKHTRNDLFEYMKDAEMAGAGEIIINSVDNDGMMSGYDLNLIEKASSAVRVPIIACGGAASMFDFRKALDSGASAVAAGSLFVFHGPNKAVLINYPSQNQIKQLFTL